MSLKTINEALDISEGILMQQIHAAAAGLSSLLQIYQSTTPLMCCTLMRSVEAAAKTVKWLMFRKPACVDLT